MKCYNCGDTIKRGEPVSPGQTPDGTKPSHRRCVAVHKTAHRLTTTQAYCVGYHIEDGTFVPVAYDDGAILISRRRVAADRLRQSIVQLSKPHRIFVQKVNIVPVEDP